MGGLIILPARRVSRHSSPAKAALSISLSDVVLGTDAVDVDGPGTGGWAAAASSDKPC